MLQCWCLVNWYECLYRRSNKCVITFCLEATWVFITMLSMMSAIFKWRHGNKLSYKIVCINVAYPEKKEPYCNIDSRIPSMVTDLRYIQRRNTGLRKISNLLISNHSTDYEAAEMLISNQYLEGCNHLFETNTSSVN